MIINFIIILCIPQSILKLSLILLPVLHKHSGSSHYLAYYSHIFKSMLGNREVKSGVCCDSNYAPLFAGQIETSTSPPPSCKARAFELLKIALDEILDLNRFAPEANMM